MSFLVETVFLNVLLNCLWYVALFVSQLLLKTIWYCQVFIHFRRFLYFSFFINWLGLKNVFKPLDGKKFKFTDILEKCYNFVRKNLSSLYKNRLDKEISNKFSPCYKHIRNQLCFSLRIVSSTHASEWSSYCKTYWRRDSLHTKNSRHEISMDYLLGILEIFDFFLCRKDWSNLKNWPGELYNKLLFWNQTILSFLLASVLIVNRRSSKLLTLSFLLYCVFQRYDGHIKHRAKWRLNLYSCQDRTYMFLYEGST